MSKPITDKQLKLVHTLRRRAMDEACYRDHLAAEYGARSTKELSVFAARKLIDHLMALTAGPGGGPTMISRKQIIMLRDLLDGSDLPGDSGVVWCRRHCKRHPIRRLDQLTRAEAARAIVAARKMHRVKNGREHAGK